MTRQEEIEALWRQFGRQPISPVPAREPMVNCRHKVVLTVGGSSTVIVDEPVIPMLVDLNPSLRAGQCPACGIIYWFTDQEVMPVVRSDKDTTPDAGGVEAIVPEEVQEREKLLAEVSESVKQHKSRRIERGRRQ